jgi:hypothetical protein
MDLSVLPTTTITPRRKRSRKPTFDPSRRWITYQTSHLDPDLHSQLVIWAASRGICVQHALNIVLGTGLRAVREGR